MAGDSSRVLSWEDVRAAAEVAFNVWVGQPELSWAEEAWGHLANAGLTSFTGESGRTDVALRFAALADLYRDWCGVAHDEEVRSEYWEYREWLESLVVKRDSLIEQVDLVLRSGWGDDEVLEQGLAEAVAQRRTEVVRVLKHTLGGDSALFLSLWRGSRSTSAHDGEDDDPATDWEILNDLTDLKLQAFAWIADGCPRR